MMNTTPTLKAPRTLHERSFGSWTVSVQRSPKRTAGPRAGDFASGSRWALFGAITGILLVAMANVSALSL